MNEEAKRKWRGIWIPKEVWLDERISALEKIILFEVDSLDQEIGCIASNEYIAKFCQCSAWKVSTAVQKLIDLGYIRVESFDGRHRTLRSNLVFFTRQPLENPNPAFGESNAINNREKNKRENTLPIKDGLDGFDEFWKVYPRHLNRQDAIKAWKALKPSKEVLEAILKDIPKKMGDNGLWSKRDKDKIPYPATYLRGRQWEDEDDDSEQPKSDEPWWKSKPWWEWPIEEQRKLEQQVEERERAERERNGG